MISINDFNSWKTDPVTVAFMQTIRNRIKDGAENLSYVAGVDSQHDNFMRGFIQGQREVLEVTFEDTIDG